MAFLPDTNVWISLLKNPGGKLDAKVRSQPVADVLLCAVVKAELWHGAEKYGNREGRLRALEMLLRPSHRSRLMTRPRDITPTSAISLNCRGG
jgi:tRNA(fMet)-specific endonuclease VapC